MVVFCLRNIVVSGDNVIPSVNSDADSIFLICIGHLGQNSRITPSGQAPDTHRTDKEQIASRRVELRAKEAGKPASELCTGVKRVTDRPSLRGSSSEIRRYRPAPRSPSKRACRRRGLLWFQYGSGPVPVPPELPAVRLRT